MRFIYLLPFLFYPWAVHAEEVEEIIISRVYSASEQSPVTFQNIEKESLKSVGLQEPSFLLQKTPSIISYSDSGSYQGYSYFRLRGIDQTRINITLDGIPLNEPEDQGVYFSNYPGVFNSLENVQIQRGVGTSQNGIASYAGSIQLFSIDLNQPEKMILESGYASFNTLSSSAQYFSGKHNDLSAYVGVAGVSSDGYKEHSGNQSRSIFFSVQKEDEYGRWRALGFSGKQENQLAWVGVESEVIEHNRRANANSENDRYEQSLISIAREQRLTDDIKLEIRGYYNKLHGSYDFDFNRFIGQPSTNELFNYGLNSDFYGIYSNIYFRADTYDWSAGVHLNKYVRRHNGAEQSLGDLYQNKGYRNSYSTFVKYNYYLGDANLFADIQYRYSDFDYRGSVDFEKVNWSFINPRIGFSFQLNNELLAYYSLGKTDREPTRTDLFGGLDNLELDENNYPIIAIVDPESVIDHELGLRFETNDLKLEANLFYMDFKNEITLNGSFGPNGLLLNQDVDRSSRKGIELSSRLNIASGFLWSSSFAYTDAVINDKNQSFHPVMTPSWMGTTGIEYSQAKMSVGLDLRYQSEIYINLTNSEKISGFTVANLYANYQLDKIGLTLKINNLFNHEYFASGNINALDNPAYFVGAPINYALSISMEI